MLDGPPDTASFRRGNTSTGPAVGDRMTGPVAEVGHVEATEPVSGDASAASLAAATVARRAIGAATDVVLEHEERLGQIDAVADDGDHGAGMARGLRAARAAGEETGGGIGSVLIAAGVAFGDEAGGSSGILWGIFLAAIGAPLGDIFDVTAKSVGVSMRHGAETIQRVGKAQLGDKTMLDALFPFVDALEQCGGASGQMPIEFGALVEPLAVAVHAVRRVHSGTHKRVLVIGGEPIGQSLVLALRMEGVDTVYVSEVDPARRALCERLGATPLDPAAGSIVDAVVAAGGLVDAAIDAVGVSATVADALNATAFGGQVCLVGMGRQHSNSRRSA